MLAIYMSLIDDPEEQKKFELLYKSYRQMMYYIANQILCNKDDAEDAVHQAFLRVINHLGDIDENDEQKTKSYLSVIVHNIAIDAYRKRKREWTRSISYDEYGIFIQDPAGQDFEEIDDEDYIGKLVEAIRKLPPQYAEVIRLTYALGYNSDKVAEILNITSDNVRQRLVRARKKLGELMGIK